MASPKEILEKAKSQGKAALDVGGAVVKTIGKRMIGNDTPTPLKPETKSTLGIK